MRALVLSGGGSKGAYQVGALGKWLGEDRIDYDIFCGISVGAINAAFLAQFGAGLAVGAFQSLDRLWRQVSDRKVWRRWFPFGAASGLWERSVYDSAPLQDWLSGGLNVTSIQTSGKRLRVSAVAWDTAEVRVATETSENLTQWVTASASYPVMLTPVEIEGRLWSDGGLRSITPLGEAIRLGADEVDVILCNNPDHLEPFDPSLAHAIPGFLVRTLDIQSAQIQIADLAVAGLKNDLCELRPEYRRVKIRLLMPSQVLAEDPLRFDPDGIQRMAQQGYEDAHRLGDTLRFFLWLPRNEGGVVPPGETRCSGSSTSRPWPGASSSMTLTTACRTRTLTVSARPGTPRLTSGMATPTARSSLATSPG
jgi:NTE family protein